MILLQAGGGFTQLIPMASIIVVFDFFMIRPQMRNTIKNILQK